MDTWSILHQVTLIMIFVGIIICYPIALLNLGRERKGKHLLEKVRFFFLKAIPIILLVGIALGIVELGDKINYELWKHYLAQDTVQVEGEFQEIRNLRIVKGGSQTFYIVSFPSENEIVTRGIPEAYISDDSKPPPLPSSFSALENGRVTIDALTSKPKVSVVYSKRFPSFFNEVRGQID